MDYPRVYHELLYEDFLRGVLQTQDRLSGIVEAALTLSLADKQGIDVTLFDDEYPIESARLTVDTTVSPPLVTIYFAGAKIVRDTVALGQDLELVLKSAE